MKTNQDSFRYQFTVPQSAEKLTKRLLDVRSWWSNVYGETFSGESEKPGDEFNFKAGGGAHDTTQRLVELVLGKKIVWLVTESNLSFLADPEEWKGTRLIFTLEPKGDETQVTFTHEGLTQAIECWDACSNGWTAYLQPLQKELQGVN